MTRYTKLEKRRPEYIKSKQASTSRSPSPSASPSTVLPLVAEAATSIGVEPDTINQQEDGRTTDNTKSTKKPLSEPTKLLKRAKLIRLKAKKAKDDFKKGALLQQVQELEKRVTVLNGERGGKGNKAGVKGTGKGKERQGGGNIGESGDDDAVAAQIAAGVNPWKAREAERRKDTEAKSAVRREKRQREKMAETMCYACRQMGHAAIDCSNSNSNSKSGSRLNGHKSAETAIGPATSCCYRCGSKEHALAKCKKPTPKVGPELPYALCFICSKKGHLASMCDQNQGRGIYPNGGCCKLCQSVDHLARDCHLRKDKDGVNAISNAAISLGGGGRAGADEDDFHSFTRKRRQVEEEEGKDIKKPRSMASTTKRVVSF